MKKAYRRVVVSFIMAVVQLKEYADKDHLELKFEDVGCVGPDHMKTFTVRAVLDGKAYPDGVGKNKKEAKQNAAKNALRDLFGGLDNSPGEERQSGASGQPEEELNQNVSDICDKTKSLSVRAKDKGLTKINFIGIVNHYCQEKNTSPDYVFVKRDGPPHNPQFFYKVVIDKKEYPVGEGKTIMEARQNAARLAWSALQEQTDFDSKVSVRSTVSEDGASNKPEEELNQNVSDICGKIGSLSVRSKDKDLTKLNFKGIVNHYCQEKNKYPDYVFVKRDGPPHNPQFFYKVVIDKKEYPVGEGKTVIEARQNAARLAWSALREQTDFDSKVSVRSTVSEDGAPPMLSAPSATLESHESPSQHTSVSTTTDSPTPSKVQVAVKDKNIGNGPKETSTQSRFTSDFDPMECLGSGAFGYVYKARHKLLDKFYAVKIVCCEEKSLREVGSLSDLQHRNIIRYYTFWMEDSGYQWDNNSSPQSTENSSSKYLYIQMELCDTKTLRGWIDEKNTQPQQDSKRREESLRIVQQIVSGVEYIHSEKHIHRDLKPANILFGLKGEVKIGDFGLVTRDDDGSSLMDRTENRGTPIYRAPEQWRENTYDRKVDIFPLGLIYFELLWKLPTGQEGRNAALKDARNQKLPENFAQSFPEENQIIKSMLREKPGDRPEASKLRAELEKWAQTFNSQNVSEESETCLL